jgi:hypothetical protein
VHDLIALLIGLPALSVAVSASRCRRLPRMYAGGVDAWDKPARDPYAERRQP